MYLCLVDQFVPCSFIMYVCLSFASKVHYSLTKCLILDLIVCQQDNTSELLTEIDANFVHFDIVSFVTYLVPNPLEFSLIQA